MLFCSCSYSTNHSSIKQRWGRRTKTTRYKVIMPGRQREKITFSSLIEKKKAIPKSTPIFKNLLLWEPTKAQEKKQTLVCKKYLYSTVPGTMRIQRVEHGILNGREVNSQVTMYNHQILTQQGKDGWRQRPHLMMYKRKQIFGSSKTHISLFLKIHVHIFES